MTAGLMFATVQPIAAMGWDIACNKKRISNIERGMSNAEAIEQRKNFIIRNSLFDIRYSF
jgi:hypothetical protein